MAPSDRQVCLCSKVYERPEFRIHPWQAPQGWGSRNLTLSCEVAARSRRKRTLKTCISDEPGDRRALLAGHKNAEVASHTTPTRCVVAQTSTTGIDVKRTCAHCAARPIQLAWIGRAGDIAGSAIENLPQPFWVIWLRLARRRPCERHRAAQAASAAIGILTHKLLF